MEKLFVFESELSAFRMLHPQYNIVEVRDETTKEVIGYECSIVKLKTKR